LAEGRFVSKSIAHDYALNCSVSFEADYLFNRCIPHLDREGRMTGHPGEVKAIAVPLRANMTPEVVDRCLGELADAELVLWYEVDSKPALWFKGFEKHQKGLRADREAASRLPAPQAPNLQRITTLLRTNSNLLRSTPAEVKVREVKSREELTTTQRVAIVENPGGDSAANARFDLLEHARRECGMGTWDTQEIRTASSVIIAWSNEGKTATDVFEAIHGARLMVDRRKVTWLTPQKPFGLQALRNTSVLFDQGDGKAPRPFFACAIEEYRRTDATGPPSRTANTGPERIAVNPTDYRQAQGSNT
jgi:hypothetical protein